MIGMYFYMFKIKNRNLVWLFMLITACSCYKRVNL